MIAECAACERVFNGLTAFDAHQSWDYTKPRADQLTCLDPATLLTKDGKPKFRLNDRKRWASTAEMPSGAFTGARESAEQAEAERDRLQTFFDAMADQRDALKAAIERVRMLLERWEQGRGTDAFPAIALRTALASLDTPTPTEKSRHVGVIDPGEPDEGPWCEACGEPFPCEEATAVRPIEDVTLPAPTPTEETGDSQ